MVGSVRTQRKGSPSKGIGDLTSDPSGPGRPPLEPYTGYFIRNWEMQVRALGHMG